MNLKKEGESFKNNMRTTFRNFLKKEGFKGKLSFGLPFLLPLFILTAVFSYLQFYPFGNTTLMSGDYRIQYIPLYRAFGNLLRSGDWGELFWSWKKGIGGVMPSVWGFNSISPFTIALALVPAKYLNDAIYITSFLRCACSGLSFYYFLTKRYKGLRNISLSLSFSTAYALNGFFMANQVNPNFLDNLPLLPLVLIGVERVLDGHLNKKYSIVLATTAIVNFYTSYMICFFIPFYALYYTLSKKYSLSESIRSYWRLLKASVLGIGLSAAWLLPVFYSLLGTKLSKESPVGFEASFLYNPLRLFWKLMVGVSSGSEWGDPTSLPTFYIGGLCIIGLLAVLFIKKLSQRSILILATIVVFAFLFSYGISVQLWHLGQMPVGFYYRNAWLLSAMLLILFYPFFQKLDSLNPLQATGIILSLLFIHGYVYFEKQQISYELVTDDQQIISLLLAVSLLSLFLLPFTKSMRTRLFLLITCLDLGINASFTLSRSLWNDDYHVLHYEEPEEKLHRQVEVATDTRFYRMEKEYYNSYNDPLTYGFNGINHFTSSIDYQNMLLLGRLGMASSKAMTVYTQGTPLVDALFNIRYFLADNTASLANSNTNPIPKSLYYNKQHKIGQVTLYETDNRFGLGFPSSTNLTNIHLSNTDTISNQNQIFQQLFQTKEEVLTKEPYISIEFENITKQAVDVDGSFVYRYQREDKNRDAKISIYFTPLTDQSYYLYIPTFYINQRKGLNFTLNGQAYTVFNRYKHPQLWGLAAESKGQYQRMELIVSNDDSYDFSQIEIYRFNNTLFTEKVNQELHTKWEPNDVKATEIHGDFTQPDGKEFLVTSIPYNENWTVFVDQKKVAAHKTLDALLTFPLSPGHHSIRIHYQPKGVVAGAAISLLSALTLALPFLKKQRTLRSK